MSEEPPSTLAGAPADTDTPALAIFPKKKNRGNIRKRPRDEDEPDGAVAVAVPAARMKPGKPASAAFTTKKAEDEKLQTFKFASSKTLQQQTDQGATRTLETETQTDRDARCALVAYPPPPPPPLVMDTLGSLAQPGDLFTMSRAIQASQQD